MANKQKRITLKTLHEMLDDMDFHYNKVKCRKIEGMLPKLMKMVEDGRYGG